MIKSDDQDLGDTRARLLEAAMDCFAERGFAGTTTRAICARAGGIVKTDGHDHCEDHFFPGFQDLAWDVAGAAIELGPAVRDAVVDALGDRALRRRVPLYEVAYAAFRVGYATFARDATVGEERARWEVELARLHREARRAVAAL